MDTNECIAFAREEASVSSTSTEWDAAKFLQLLNQVRVDVFEPVITACKCGYWTHVLTRTLGANNTVVRLPPRAAAFLHVDIRHGTGRWVPLQEATEAEQQDWERISGNFPVAYIIRGSTMHLMPAAVDNSYSIRIKIVVRPSKLYLPQSAGLVTAVDLTTNIITVSSLPVNNLTSAPITGTLDIDIIEPSDNYELSLFNAQATVTDSTHVTVASGYSLNRIQPGDYMRAANQSDWPQLPEPFHHVLASAAAITPCTQRDLYDRAQDLRQSVSSAVIRLATHLAPRSKTQTQERRPIQHSWE
jgi:hypothetical protein